MAGGQPVEKLIFTKVAAKILPRFVGIWVRFRIGDQVETIFSSNQRFILAQTIVREITMTVLEVAVAT